MQISPIIKWYFCSFVVCLLVADDRGCEICCGADSLPLPQPSLKRTIDAGLIIPSKDAKTAIVVPKRDDTAPYLFDIVSNRKTSLRNMPKGSKLYAVTYSADEETVVGVIGGGTDDSDRLIEWNAANANRLSLAEFPKPIVHCMSLRCGRDGNVYVGTDHNLFVYSTVSRKISNLIADAKYYVIDVTTGGDRLAYIDQSRCAQFSSLAESGERRTIFGLCPAERTHLLSVDLSSDRSEVVIGGVISAKGKEAAIRGEISRFNSSTRKREATILTTDEVRSVRYVGNSKVLIIQTAVPEEMGGNRFGFIKPDSVEIDDWRQTESEISGLTINPASDGHLTIGLDNGTLLQWSRNEWPEKWGRLFEE